MFYEEKGEFGGCRSESICFKWGTLTIFRPKNQKHIIWTTTKLKNNKTIKDDEINNNNNKLKSTYAKTHNNNEQKQCYSMNMNNLKNFKK
jgi:hypothetical protein